MTDPLEAKSSAASPEQPGTDPQLDSLRSILLNEERKRIHQLEEETEALQEQAKALQAELEQLREQLNTDSQALIPKLIQQMSYIITNTIRDKRDELAEALGPIMSDAIRVQIRDSRKEMVEALYPIVLETVMRAVTEFLREFQRNIDARLKSTLNLRGFLNQVQARLRGVSASELTLRESFTFSIEELFLIQHDSGLLLAHHSRVSEENDDSDLIGGMLTAIRDFARDSFGEGDDEQELREIEFGDERIIIQSGQYLYAAAVIKGIEPTGFHAQLQKLVSELHIQHKPQLRDYAGDPATLPNLAQSLTSFSQRVAMPEVDSSGEMTRGQRWLLVGGAGLTLLLTAVACFYLQFTLALYPLAFGSTPTPTVTPTQTATLEPSSTPLPPPTATSTPLPTSTATNTAVPPTSTPTASPTATATPEPTNTPTPRSSPVTASSVWARDEPDLEAPTTFALPANTAVTILAQIDEWVQVEWQDNRGTHLGWIGIRWLVIDGAPLSNVATPTGG